MWIDEWEEIPKEEWPIVNEHSKWEVLVLHRDTACENRRHKKIRAWVYDKDGKLLPDVKIRIDVEPSDTGTAYDHPNIWQYTGSRRGRKGYWEWEHLGKPTRYVLWMENDERPLIENIRTDLGNEYCKRGRWPWEKWGYNPQNMPGIYSYRIEIRQR